LSEEVRRGLDYPRHAPSPKARIFGSVTYDDPDHALEEDDAQVLAWQAAQDDVATAYLTGLPGYAPLGDLLRALGSSSGVAAPQYSGGRWFRQVIPAGDELAAILVSENPTGPGRRVIDLNRLFSGVPLRLHWFAPSPDGRKLAFSWSPEGKELENLQVIDVDGGALLLEGVPQANGSFPAWLPDSSGFYYRGNDPALAPGKSLIFHHRLGEGPPTLPEPLELGDPVAWPAVSADGRHVLVYSSYLSPRPDYIRATDGDGGWRPFLKDLPGCFRGVASGDHFFAITDDGAPRGRLVAIPLASPTARDGWRELVAPSDNVLASIAAVGERLVLVELVDAYARLRVLRIDGSIEGTIDLPGRGMVSMRAGNSAALNFMDCLVPGAGDELLFVFSSLRQSPALYRASAASRTCEPLVLPAARLDAEVEDCAATSRDGTPIPYRRVVPRGDARAAQRPTVILEYAGANIALLPGWPGEMLAAWVQAGGVLVLAHLRGGGEFGPNWWRGGWQKQRQNTFDDLYAVAEDLCAREVTRPAQLGLYGISNGGKNAAAAAVQRPDLFAAVVAQAPLTDMFGLVRDPVAYMVAKMEDGDPCDPEMSKILRGWSPYQNVADGVAYPAMLIDCGLNDARRLPWHGRKLAARMQRATSSRRPILLRVRASADQAALTDAERHVQRSETLAFLAEQLGLPAGASCGKVGTGFPQ